MQGGRQAGGTGLLSDRWMFDPTGNQGNGHWQLMGELPPRAFAAMTQLDYQTRYTGANHIALLFGGETGLQNPSYFQDGKYFVAPTLGDTWMYDFVAQRWNRVKLVGTRSQSPDYSQIDPRLGLAASDLTDSSTQILTPPPLSGAVMVTRTVSRTNHSIVDTPKTLRIPEVFLFGGRNKEGKYEPLRKVYKFCAGSTGEKPYPYSPSGTAVSLPDDASCDAYDPIENPNSANPTSDYTGRWLFKSPTSSLTLSPGNDISLNKIASYLGAGTYDPTHDVIALYGGLTPAPAPSANAAAEVGSVAVTATRNVNGDNGEILEYIAPSQINTYDSNLTQGKWNYVPACGQRTEKPKGRYGHSMSYDPGHQNLVISGGFDVTGTPLTQTVTVPKTGATVTLPEIWTATRIDEVPQGSLSDLNIPESDLGGIFPCYYWKKVTQFGNLPSSAAGINQAPGGGFAHATALLIPPVGYNTGYYTLNGPACTNAGAIANSDQYVGGVFIDINRRQLNSGENLLLTVTLLPFGSSNTDPQGNLLDSAQAANFRVRLVATNDSLDRLLQEIQPRSRAYWSDSSYPTVVQDLAILAPPVGQIRQEQILIPLTINSSINRIQIERVSGTGIILNANLVRLNPGGR